MFANARKILTATIAALALQGCGNDFMVKTDLKLSSLAASSVCASDLEAQFESSYHSFLKQNCAACHSGNGPGQGAFAVSDTTTAYNAFVALGVDKINSNAVNPSHAGGYTGTQNQAAITVASQQWDAALSSCKSTTSNTQGITTSAKSMNANGTDKDISFNLDTDRSAGSTATGGAVLKIAVREVASQNGSPVYYFTNPRLVGGSKSLTVMGLMVKINGATQSLGTTWSRASGSVSSGQTATLSTATMIVQYDTAVPATDTLAIQIDTVTAQ